MTDSQEEGPYEEEEIDSDSDLHKGDGWKMMQAQDGRAQPAEAQGASPRKAGLQASGGDRTRSAKKKRRKEKKKGAVRWWGACVHSLVLWICSGRAEGGGEAAQAVTARGIQEMLNKLTMEEHSKGHNFWDTQPVPKICRHLITEYI